MENPAESPVDLAKLRATLTDLGAPAVFRELLTVFLHDTPERLAALRHAAAAGDARAVRFAAHTLKGTCGYLGAHGLVRICREIEARSSAGPVAPDLPLLAELEAEFRRVRAALERELGETPG
ncbi:MAG: Hpt domain-containing protein [Candidatus Rokubacteria bacterium]|nr:Hpt domain-containing protein [Candidatus Rokubacteria bacterium]